jgi:C-terminal processing protease CtpA/Prc
MANRKQWSKNEPPKRARKKPAAAAGAAVSGAEPYQPKMTASQMRSAVSAQIGQRIKLADYRDAVKPLTFEQRDALIDEALEMLDQVYAHLPLKRALHANDPIQSLRLLRLRHASLDERGFQSALMAIFLGLRDLHTNYILPDAYAQKFAFLPFRVEEFYEASGVVKDGTNLPAPKYVVSWVAPVNTVTTLKEGMVVTHWNGSPIALAVARNGDREAGSNADARRAQGVEALTLRWLGMSLPPDEDWVNLTYTDGAKTYEARFDWEVIDNSDRPALLAGSDEGSSMARKLGLDLKRLLLDRARKLIFDPQAVAVEQDAKQHLAQAGAAVPPPRPQTSVFPVVFPWFGEVTTPSGKYGYIRLKSFDPELKAADVVDQVVAEFVRILKTLPQTGLILDVRGNGGGYIEIGEQILQTLTQWQITPEPFQFLATPLALQIVSDAKNGLDEWAETIVQGLESGASFSQGFPLSDPDRCNAIGQIYQGPVVLVTDALCYSTTDIFSAGFQDHQIGTVLGCHSSTGAGGANVWDYHNDLQQVSLSPNPFGDLPDRADMRVAIRRSTRVGSRSGIPVEDYGVTSDVRYLMSKADVVGHNADLIAAAAKILKDKPAQTLQLKPQPSDPLRKFVVDCSNIDRVDFYVDGRPAVSQEITGDQTGLAITLPFAAPAKSVVVADGYRKGDFVVSTRLTAGT